ncbi:MAG: hypothetical protein AABY03_00760, partial [Nanoarchaeota archaeon]
MTNKIFALFALSVFVFAFLVAGVSAATLADYDLTSVATATTSNANVVVSALTVGPVTGIDTGILTFSVANGATATTTLGGWDETTLAAAVTDGDYYQVTLTPNVGVNT